MLGVSRFEDLEVYQLAVQLRREVVRLSSTGAVAHDFRFVTQICDAARGGPRNIAEGFSRFVPSEFSHFLSYAKASIDETRAHIQDARDSGYFSDEECDRLLILIRRTIGGITRLMAYLATRGETSAGIRPTMHPRWRRCSSIKYGWIFSVVAPGHRGASSVSVLDGRFTTGCLTHRTPRGHTNDCDDGVEASLISNESRERENLEPRP